MMTTDQLNALIRAADDEAQLPVTAGRAAAVNLPEAGGVMAEKARQGIPAALVAGLISGLVAAGVVSLFSADGRATVVVGVFFAVTVAQLVVVEALSFLRGRL